MLLAIIKVYSYLGATDFALISVSEINLEYQKILWLAFFLAFAIKTPLWPFTGWLFRAHVEAPLSGSVILAAVILKLATYGAKWFGKSLIWEKLSNSGDTLKLIIPSHNRKVMSGQSNYLGMVTSYKMSENEMGNRGSKSEIQRPQANDISVKEQRIEGSWFIRSILKLNMNLRFILMGLERDYQIKILSKQLKNYCTNSVFIATRKI